MNYIKNNSISKSIFMRVYDAEACPTPLFDGRLVSYFVSKNNMAMYSFPMCTVKHVDYCIESFDRILITEENNNNNNEEHHTILIFDNETIAKAHFNMLSQLQKKWYGKPYNCNDVSMPEF